jgi:hypothetical protein
MSQRRKWEISKQERVELEVHKSRVVRMNFTTVSKLISGCPAQLVLMRQNKRCSTGFHLDAPVG